MSSQKEIEYQIRRQVLERSDPPVLITTKTTTPSGRLRKAPIYEAVVENTFLKRTKVLKAPTVAELKGQINSQVSGWKEAEIRRRVDQALDEAQDQAATATREAQAKIDALLGILDSVLDKDFRIDWVGLYHHVDHKPFDFIEPPPQPQQAPQQPLPGKPILAWVSDSEEKAWQSRCDAIQARNHQTWEACKQGHELALGQWNEKKQRLYELYLQDQREQQRVVSEFNGLIDSYKEEFENGDPATIVQYLVAIFERSIYPEGVSVERSVGYLQESKTAVVDLLLPGKEIIPDLARVKFVKSRGVTKQVLMTEDELDALYDSIVCLSVLRTFKEVFSAVYTQHVQRVAVNACAVRPDEATGQEIRICFLSVAAERGQFESINLTNKGLDPSKCLDSLRASYNGRPCAFKVVQPIQAIPGTPQRHSWTGTIQDISDRIDRMSWGELEDFIGKLLEKMFVGARVEVTQRTRDDGVDAFVYDPDPLRGGKYVVQVKKFSNLVSLNHVQALAGTLNDQGAVKGILVTTSRFGPESRAFANRSRIRLIEGDELIRLIEQHGLEMP